MANVIIENTREHDITLHIVVDDGEVRGITIPGAREHPNDSRTMVNGLMAVDSDALAAAKKNPVVSHYFDEGWLRNASTKTLALNKEVGKKE